MPDENSKTEATLADLAVNLVLGRTPALADHYLGFDLIPGSVNDTKTRAAGLLGFRIGQETVCIPVLFLNGKVKGTEVLYMQGSDVFTSNSKQWIDYLMSKDSCSMGAGATPSHPLQTGANTLGMRVFSRNPGSVTKSAEFFEDTAKDFWNKIASADPEAADLHKNPDFTLKGVLTKLGKKAYTDFLDFLDTNPALLAKVAHHFDMEKEVFITEWPEEKTAAVEELDPFDGAKVICIRSSDLMSDRLSKTATLANLELPLKERCMRDGIVFIDKRAADSTSLVVREEYRNRFSAPNKNGFFEILNRGGELEKVFVAQSPLLIEDPARSLPGCLILDPDSGVFTVPPMGKQVFVRSEFVTDEAVWKEKFSGMAAPTSMEVNKSYMLISPSMNASVPFRVNGKVKQGEDLHFVCESPWDYRYRGGAMGTSSYGLGCTAPCSGSPNGAIVKVVDREDESKVARVGNVVFVPSSWRVQEVYGDSTGLEYFNDYVPPQESAQEKQKRLEREEKRKAYFKILPGDSGTLNAITSNRDQFKLTLQKEASDRFQLGMCGTILPPMSRNDALESMVLGLNLPIEKAAELLDETLDHKGISAFLIPKTAALGGFVLTPHEAHAAQTGANAGDAIGIGVGGVAGLALPVLGGRWLGGQIGSLTSDDPETQARRKRIGSLIGLLGGVAAGVPGAVYGAILGGVSGQNLGAQVGLKTAAPANPFAAWASRGLAKGAGIDGSFVSTDLDEASRRWKSIGISDEDKRKLEEIAKQKGNKLFHVAPESSLSKKAFSNGLNQDGAIYGGMPMPDLPTDMGYNRSNTPEQTGGFTNQVIPMNSMRNTDDNWRDPDFANWDRMKHQDLDFLMRASDTGSKPVFESSMINLLLYTNRVQDQVQEWLPDLVNSNDSKCRLLLLFYWHSKNFSDDYGKDQMAEFEDVLLNAIKSDGQLILFLKQKAGESSQAMTSPFQ